MHHVKANGDISTLAVFPSRASGRTTDSVPTTVATGPDGAYYVGELTGVPFAAGAAKVYRVLPGHAPEIVHDGFKTIIDIAAYAATPPVQRPAAPPEDQQRIAAVLSEFQSAWNAHDATRFAMVFAEDAEFTNVAGRSARGRLEVERFHSPRFATTFKDSRLTIERVSIRLLRGDVASVDAWWQMTGARTSQGDTRPLRKGQMHLVMTKDGDTWAILVMHNLELAERSSAK